MIARIFEWNGSDLPDELRRLLPDELRDLPPGSYLVERVEDDDELTPEERAGILEALADLDENGGIPFEEVEREFRQRYDLDSHDHRSAS